MIIDFHTHIFPDALAPRAIASLQFTAGIPAVFDGTAKGLLELIKEDGIQKAVILNTVTNLKQVDNVNSFALSTMDSYENLIPFASLHPLCEEPEKIIDRLKSKGIKGLKLHPDYLGIPLDDERMYRLLSAIEKSNLPVVIHAGYDPVSPNKIHASPDAILKTINRFPNLILVVAHLGGVAVWDEVIEKLCGKNIYFDTAFCCERVGISIEQGKKIFALHSHEKILFGSDAPWARPREILEYLNRLDLAHETMEKVLWKNAENLLSL